MLRADRLLPASRVERICLAAFLLSTPLSAFAAFGGGGCGGNSLAPIALANSYAFSSAYCLLYLWPLLEPRAIPLVERLERATANWVIWLTCFTEVVFQIPHNALVGALASRRGTLFEWPFYAYGLSDARWSTYTDGYWATASTVAFTGRHRFPSAAGAPVGLAPEVWLINWNDGLLGAIVALLLLRQARRPTPARALGFVLALLFRDATLFRETVEYLLVQHHMAGYPHSVADPTLRPHAIACLWLVNGPCLVAPLLSFAWAACRLMPLAEGMVATRPQDGKREEVMAAAATAARPRGRASKHAMRMGAPHPRPAVRLFVKHERKRKKRADDRDLCLVSLHFRIIATSRHSTGLECITPPYTAFTIYRPPTCAQSPTRQTEIHAPAAHAPSTLKPTAH